MDRDLQPASAASVDAFMRLYRKLCPTANDEVSLAEFARQFRRPVDSTRALARWLDDRGLIETNAGMGDEITVIEGRSGT